MLITAVEMVKLMRERERVVEGDSVHYIIT